MQVRQVVELAREWVELEGCKTPGFRAAHLMGGIVTMLQGAPFATYRDVDLSIVVPDGSGYESGRDNVELPYRGVILEVSFHELEMYGSPETVLADPEFATCFAVDSILADPTGMLQALHKAVAKDYARREWVLARCEYEKEEALEHLQAISQGGDSPGEMAYHVGRAVGYLAGLIAVASLRQPTHRRCLALMRELLERQGRSDLCEEALRVLGCAHMTRAQVESYLQNGARAFDRAVEVKRSPSPYGFKLHSHVRPYFVQAAQEMIDEGHHREAIWWIWAFHYLSNAAIQNDAPEGEKARFQAGFDRLLEGLGLNTPEGCACRLEQTRVLAEEVFHVADDIVAQNPEIVD